MRRATAGVFPCLLDCIKRAQPRVAGGSKNHVDAFADLRQRDFLSFTRIVPRRVSDSYVVLNDFNIRVCSFRALFVSALKPVNQSDVHAADETNSSGFGSHAGEQAHEIGSFMLLKNERRYIWKFAHAV